MIVKITKISLSKQVLQFKHISTF